MRKISIFILFFLVLGLISCSSSKEISPKEAYEMMNKNDNYTLIDLSKPPKYRDGHIKGAILIEFHPKTFKKEILVIDKTKPIIIYCGTGKKTDKAVSVMENLGFKGFYIISGGLRAWKEVKLPIVK